MIGKGALVCSYARVSREIPARLWLLAVASASFSLPVLVYAGELPVEGSWKTGVTTAPFEPRKDRIFLVNKNWVEGEFLSLDSKSVRFTCSGAEHQFSREEVSLVELSPWIKRETRNEKKEKTTTLVVVITGSSSCGTLIFTGGTIIKDHEKVKPEFTKGKDPDDKVAVSPTSIFYNKEGPPGGGRDNDETELRATVELILGRSGVVTGELQNNFQNSPAGRVKLEFSLVTQEKKEAKIGEVSSRKVGQDGDWGWLRFVIDYTKEARRWRMRSWVEKQQLLVPDPEEIEASEIGVVPKKMSGKEVEPSRLVLVGDRVETAYLASADRRNVTTYDKKSFDAGEVMLIELNDWKDRFKKQDSSGAAPMPTSVVVWGTGHAGTLTFGNEGRIKQLIAPPHFLKGRDCNDTCAVLSEKSIRFDKKEFDLSPVWVETVIVLGKPGKKERWRYNEAEGEVSLKCFDVLTGNAWRKKSETLVNGKQFEMSSKK
jgi:hypothetical protein